MDRDLEKRDRGPVSSLPATQAYDTWSLSTWTCEPGLAPVRGMHAARMPFGKAGGVHVLQAADDHVQRARLVGSIRREGVLRSSTGGGKIAFVHPDDIAPVATAALTTRDHDGQALVITGRMALSYGEMAATIGRAIGKPVGFEEISDGQVYAGAVEWAGKGPYVDALVGIWRAVREGRPGTVTDGVKRVTGRAPISFAQWAAAHAAAFQ